VGDQKTEGTKQKESGSMIWETLSHAAREFAIGSAARKIATSIVPEVIERHGIQVLQPMSRFAANVKPIAQFVGKHVGDVPNPYWEAAKILITHPTNNFPSSRSEKQMQRIWSDARRREEAYAAKNAANVALAHAKMASQAAAASKKPSSFLLKRPAILNTQPANEAVRRNRNTLTLGKPAILSHPPPTVVNRLEPLKLRPAQNISTPFNVRLMRPPVSANPFKLSVMGQPSGNRFGVHL
jgi:hypothetical protein